MTDWTDPQTFWLNLTNAFLGLVCLAALATVVGVTAYDLVARWLAQREFMPRTEPHAFQVPALGLTMADGGVPRDGTDAKDTPRQDGRQDVAPVDGSRTDAPGEGTAPPRSSVPS